MKIKQSPDIAQEIMEDIFGDIKLLTYSLMMLECSMICGLNIRKHSILYYNIWKIMVLT
jgi:hypothetical protein